MDRTGIVKKFLDGLPARFEVASGDLQMNTVLLDVDESAVLSRPATEFTPTHFAGARAPSRSIQRLRFKLD